MSDIKQNLSNEIAADESAANGAAGVAHTNTANAATAASINNEAADAHSRQLAEQIAAAIARKLPIAQAFSELFEPHSDNEITKALCRELIKAYTQSAREQLEQASEALQNAHFAYTRAEDALLERLNESFNALLSAGLNDVCKAHLEQLALSDLSGLHVLGQTAQSAYIGLLEDGQLVYERASRLASYLLLNAHRSTCASSALVAARSILEPALELANLWQSYAHELLRGCIAGLCEALELLAERAIKELQNDCAAPGAQEFLSLETDFCRMIASLSSGDFAGSILREIYDNELESLSAKLSRAIGRGRFVLGQKFSSLSNAPGVQAAAIAKLSQAKERANRLQLDVTSAASRLLEKLRK